MIYCASLSIVLNLWIVSVSIWLHPHSTCCIRYVRSPSWRTLDDCPLLPALPSLPLIFVGSTVASPHMTLTSMLHIGGSKSSALGVWINIYVRIWIYVLLPVHFPMSPFFFHVPPSNDSQGALLLYVATFDKNVQGTSGPSSPFVVGHSKPGMGDSLLSISLRPFPIEPWCLMLRPGWVFRILKDSLQPLLHSWWQIFSFPLYDVVAIVLCYASILPLCP